MANAWSGAITSSLGRGLNSTGSLIYENPNGGPANFNASLNLNGPLVVSGSVSGTMNGLINSASTAIVGIYASQSISCSVAKTASAIVGTYLPFVSGGIGQASSIPLYLAHQSTGSILMGHGFIETDTFYNQQYDNLELFVPELVLYFDYYQSIFINTSNRVVNSLTQSMNTVVWSGEKYPFAGGSAFNDNNYFLASSIVSASGGRYAVSEAPNSPQPCIGGPWSSGCAQYGAVMTGSQVISPSTNTQVEQLGMYLYQSGLYCIRYYFMLQSTQAGPGLSIAFKYVPDSFSPANYVNTMYAAYLGSRNNAGDIICELSQTTDDINIPSPEAWVQYIGTEAIRVDVYVDTCTLQTSGPYTGYPIPSSGWLYPYVSYTGGASVFTVLGGSSYTAFRAG